MCYATIGFPLTLHFLTFPAIPPRHRGPQTNLEPNALTFFSEPLGSNETVCTRIADSGPQGPSGQDLTLRLVPGLLPEGAEHPQWRQEGQTHGPTPLITREPTVETFSPRALSGMVGGLCPPDGISRTMSVKFPPNEAALTAPPLGVFPSGGPGRSQKTYCHLE